MVFCVGGFKNTAKYKWNKIDSKGNWPALNLVMVLGNEMDVQHTHRWQNRDVAFLMDSALLKKKGAGRAVRLWKTRFVFDCVGARHRQDVYCTCKGISPQLL